MPKEKVLSDEAEVINRINNKVKGRKERSWFVDKLIGLMTTNKNVTRINAENTKEGIVLKFDNGKTIALSEIYKGSSYSPEKYTNDKHRLQCILWAIGPKMVRDLKKQGFKNAGQGLINSQLCVVKDTTRNK
jgi:hypothetical protein